MHSPAPPLPPVLAPIAAGERMHTLDVVRGFALLGIFLMNIEGMVGPVAASGTGLDPALAGAHRWADAAIYLLVQGKFFTLFSLLFGMGFAMMVMRAQAAGRPFAGMYWRRSLSLLAIGLVHALLIWSGDILVIYALLSIPLLAFRDVPARWLAWLGVAVYLAAPAMLMGLGLMSLWVPGWDEMMAPVAAQSVAMDQAQVAAYGSGSYGMAVAQRLRDFSFMLSGLMVFGAMVFGMFLIGAAFMRSGAIQHPQQYPRLYTQLRWSVLALGLLAMLASFLVQPTVSPTLFNLHTGVAQSLAAVAGLLMCLGYLAWVMRGLEVPKVAGYLHWLAPAGRMALTNYLVQSIVCTLVFYGYGLGFFEHLPRMWQVPFALGLYTVQVLYSHWWLQRFRFGPAEWLWRSITYWKLQPMRRIAA